MMVELAPLPPRPAAPPKAAPKPPTPVEEPPLPKLAEGAQTEDRHPQAAQAQGQAATAQAREKA
jgi:protein TonB